jgi:hypothetical protein
LPLTVIATLLFSLGIINLSWIFWCLVAILREILEIKASFLFHIFCWAIKPVCFSSFSSFPFAFFVPLFLPLLLQEQAIHLSILIL